MNARSKAVAVGCSLVLAAALQTGCATTQKTTASSPKPAAPVTQATPQSDNEPITGKVVETMDSGGYTYVSLEKDGKRTWVAMPPLKVEAGQELKLAPGVQMGTFTSRTLNRTFEGIIFSYGLLKDAAPKKSGTPAGAGTQPSLPPGHPAMGQTSQPAQGHPSATPQSAAGGSTISGKVVETMDSGGYTYVNLDKNGKKIWVALPVTQVSIGQELELVNGAVMTNFSSTSLNRTFDSIIFSAGLAAKK